ERGTASALPLGLAAVVLDGAAAIEHHLGVLLLREAGHRGRHELERLAIRREELRQVVDVAAEMDHALPVALQYRLALLRAHGELAQVLVFVRLEFLAVRRLHERHAELVDPVALPRTLRIEKRSARNIVEALDGLAPDGVICHANDSS